MNSNTHQILPHILFYSSVFLSIVSNWLSLALWYSFYRARVLNDKMVFWVFESIVFFYIIIAFFSLTSFVFLLFSGILHGWWNALWYVIPASHLSVPAYFYLFKGGKK
jgi:hypothetical protein